MDISSVILIGPIRTGKSTLAQKLAEDLELPRRSLDDLRWQYYTEIGFDPSYSNSLAEAKLQERRRYWSKHDPHAIERFLADYGRNHVLDFGGSHSLHEDESQLQQVQTLLHDFPNVVLVLPMADVEESLAILNERRGGPHMLYGFDLNRLMLEHPSNYTLARHIIYTHGKSVAEASLELRQRLDL